ncbi:MAG TPA: hypothetical protein VK217_10665 [Acidimicrobiales bacterium]|nr:hypothetical protein [Acidimicrobiales bacterium]
MIVLVAAIGILAVPFLVACVQLLAHRGPVYLIADPALVDVDVRTALRWHLLLGPYDRYGWHHPGPAFAYLLATIERVVGTGPVGDSLGVAIINASAALGTVALVRRRVGDLAGLWAAGVLAALCLKVGPTNLLASWGPDVLALPTIFLGALCAEVARRNLVAIMGALVVATFLVQTQLATLPIALGMMLAGVVLAWIHTRRKAQRRPSRRSLIAIGLLSLLLVAFWFPPVLEQILRIGQAPRSVVVSGLHPSLPQVDSSQGNFVAIWHFFRTPHPGHSLASAVSLLVPQPVMVLLLLAALGVAIAMGRRVAGGFGADLGIITLVAAVSTLFAVTRIVGQIQGFDLTWDKAVPVLGAIGVGVTLLGRLQAFSPGQEPSSTGPAAGRYARLVPHLGTAALVAVVVSATFAGASFLFRFATYRVTYLSAPSLAAAWTFVTPELQDKASVFVVPLNGLSYGVAAGIVDQLVARDVRATVPAAWSPEFGIGRVTADNEQVEVLVNGGLYTGSQLLHKVFPGPPWPTQVLVLARHQHVP